MADYLLMFRISYDKNELILESKRERRDPKHKGHFYWRESGLASFLMVCRRTNLTFSAFQVKSDTPLSNLRTCIT